MPLLTVSNGPPPPPSRPPHALAPQALAPKAPPPMQPSMAPQPSPPTLNRNQAPVPSIPPPNVDMRALMAALPKRMREGETVLVEISVPRRALEIPLTPGHRWPPLRVATMRLKGAPDDVHLELASPETLWISPPRVHQGADDAAWRWRLTPRTAGRLKVTLAGATRIVGGEGISGEIPLGEESVEIDVLQRGSRRGFVGLLLFGNLLALGLLAMIMSGRAEELLFAAWTGIRGMIGGG